MHHLLLSYKPDEEQHSAKKHVNVDIFRFSLHFSATNLYLIAIEMHFC